MIQQGKLHQNVKLCYYKGHINHTRNEVITSRYIIQHKFILQRNTFPTQNSNDYSE